MDLHNPECCTIICGYITKYRELGLRLKELRQLKAEGTASFEHVIELTHLIRERTELKAKVENIIWAE